jgi:hypothetical protein
LKPTAPPGQAAGAYGFCRSSLDDIPAEGSDIYRIAQGTILRRYKVMVIYRGTTRLALNDDYDFVQLRYPDGTLADEVFWERDPGVDYSISRNGAGPGAPIVARMPTELPVGRLPSPRP